MTAMLNVFKLISPMVTNISEIHLDWSSPHLQIVAL
jgi:hypothetical protein